MLLRRLMEVLVGVGVCAVTYIGLSRRLLPQGREPGLLSSVANVARPAARAKRRNVTVEVASIVHFSSSTFHEKLAVSVKLSAAACQNNAAIALPIAAHSGAGEREAHFVSSGALTTHVSHSGTVYACICRLQPGNCSLSAT